MLIKKAFHRISLQRIVGGILERPWAAVFLLSVVSLLFALQIPRLSFQTSVYDLVIEGLPEAVAHQKFKARFGSDEIIRVVVRAGDVYAPAAFENITALAHAAADIPGVRRVIGLPGIRQAMDPAGSMSLEQFAGLIAPVALFKRNIVSEDRKSTILTLLLDSDADHPAVIAAVERLMQERAGDLSLYQIGMPLVSQALVDLTQRDFFRLPPLTILLIGVVLLALFRSFHGLLLPLVCVLLALLWTFGLMAWVRIPLSMLTMVVPVFLIAVGTAYCLHIMAEYMVCVRTAESRTAAILATYGAIGFPTALAVVTTVIGLGSLLVNRIPTIREFALFACFGMISLLVVLLTLLPALLKILPPPRPRAGAASDPLRIPWVDRIIEGIITLNLNRQAVTLPIMAGIVIACILGIFRLKAETNPMGYFKADVPVSRHFHDIYRDMSGSFPINVTMTGNAEDYFEDPGHLADIERLQRYLDTLPGVDKTVSFVDYLKLVNYASNRFAAESYVLPTEGWELRTAMNNYKSLLGDDMFERFMTADLTAANIVLLTHLSSSREFLKTRNEILKHVREHFPTPLAWDVTGFGVVISASSHLLTGGQIKSLSITMVLVFGMMFVLFLSSKVGFIAAATNLFPVVTLFGIMGWAGIELSMFTGLIASIAIGLAVDDTIHYLVRYNREFRKDLDDRHALRETLRQVGRPIIFTTVTISIGFSLLLLSGFKATAVFGILMVVTMVSALAGDMILLPSLMMHVELVTLWDLVRLKLGMEPRHGIPLFQNMSRTEVHYICMAGALRTYTADTVLFRKGEPSDSMYAVISGEMDVVDHDVDARTGRETGFRKRLSTLRAGDVVGEMGLLRSAPRSATVVARKSGELLRINLKMIQRLQWLYPPTAHKFFFNLMTILCDRLERVSHSLYESSMVDDLTGLCNRKSFMESLEKETCRAYRYRTDLSVCLIRFHREADDAADACFAAASPPFWAVVDTLLERLRKSDTFGRLDAMTFALIMPQTPEEKAALIRDRLEKMLNEAMPGAFADGPAYTISLTSLRRDADETGIQLVARAEQAV